MENNFYEMLQNETHKENEKIKIKIGIRQIFIEKVRGTNVMRMLLTTSTDDDPEKEIENNRTH